MKVSEQLLAELMDNVRGYVFPDYYAYDTIRIREIMERLSDREKAFAFIDSLPEIRRMLLTDVEAVAQNDPAADGVEEIILCYPAIKVMLHYRTAHRMLELGIPIVPRVLTEMAHSATGVDIHPAARIGEYFAIDHGTGIVVGKTAVIGNHVMLYQGVTLGAKNFRYDEDRRPLDLPRHPVLEDNVTVYSNASILGRVTIGHDSVVGGNVWLTHDVPPHSRITQSRFSSHIAFSDGEGI